MYQVPISYANYYKDFIDRDVRQFRLECTIESNIHSEGIPESEIASLSIDYDLLSGAEEYTIGSLVSGKLTMRVSSNVSVFETNTITLTVSLRAEDIRQREIWIPIPLGRFHVFNVSSTTLSKTIVAYDDLYKKEMEQNFKSELQYPTTTHKVIGELCSILDIDYDTNSVPDVQIARPLVVTDTVKTSEGKYEVVKTDSNQVCFGLKVGNSLSSIAAYLGGNFFVDGDLKLQFVKYPTSTTKSYDFTKFAMPTYGSAYYNIRRISCTGYTEEVIEANVDNDTGTAMALSSPFITQEKLTQLLDELKNISYQQVKVKVKGDPTLQVGDLIELYEISSSGVINNKIQIPILRMNFHYSGGCTNEIESPCKAEAEKTINYKGTISSRLDGLESTVSSSGSEIERLGNSIAFLGSVKDNLDAMNLFINSLPLELSEGDKNQYNLILDQIKQSGKDFDREYSLVYNSKYL